MHMLLYEIFHADALNLTLRRTQYSWKHFTLCKNPSAILLPLRFEGSLPPFKLSVPIPSSTVVQGFLKTSVLPSLSEVYASLCQQYVEYCH